MLWLESGVACMYLELRAVRLPRGDIVILELWNYDLLQLNMVAVGSLRCKAGTLWFVF